MVLYKNGPALNRVEPLTTLNLLLVDHTPWTADHSAFSDLSDPLKVILSCCSSSFQFHC